MLLSCVFLYSCEMTAYRPKPPGYFSISCLSGWCFASAMRNICASHLHVKEGNFAAAAVFQDEWAFPLLTYLLGLILTLKLVHFLQHV